MHRLELALGQEELGREEPALLSQEVGELELQKEEEEEERM